MHNVILRLIVIIRTGRRLSSLFSSPADVYCKSHHHDSCVGSYISFLGMLPLLAARNRREQFGNVQPSIFLYKL